MHTNPMEVRKLPECCRSRMTITMDSRLYVEFMCDSCGSVIYMKKKDIPKLQHVDRGDNR